MADEMPRLTAADLRVYDTASGKLMGGLRTATSVSNPGNKELELYMAPKDNVTETGNAASLNFSYLNKVTGQSTIMLNISGRGINFINGSMKNLSKNYISNAAAPLSYVWVSWSDVGNNYKCPAVRLGVANGAGIAWYKTQVYSFSPKGRKQLTV